MIEEVAVKTHLIVTEVHEEYFVDWCGRIIDTKPAFKDGLPIFVIIGRDSRIELNTLDMRHLEDCAKSITSPQGRGAVSTDKSRIYLQEESGELKLMGVVTHNRVKKYSQMYDKVGYR